MANAPRSSLIANCAAACAAVAMLVAPVCAGVPYIGDMTEYRMPGYTLVAIDDMTVKKSCAMLPRLRRSLAKTMQVQEKDIGIPTYIHVVSGGVWDRYLEPSPHIVGEYVPTRFANHIIASIASFSRVGLFHEYSHLFLRTQVDGAFPLWFDEGMAQFVAEAQYLDGKTRFRSFRGQAEGGWVDIERLLRATRTSPEYLSRSESLSFHFQSQMIFQRAFLDEPAFGEKVMNYVRLVNELKPIDEAVRASFQVDERELDRQFRGHLARSLRHSATVDLDGVKDEPLINGRKLTRQESLLTIANVVLDTGFGLSKAHELLDELAEINPANQQIPILRFRLAARRGDDVELERLLGVLQPRFAEPDVARAVGLALHQRVLDVEKLPAQPMKAQLWLERAHVLLNTTLTARPDDAEAVWSYAMTAAALKRDIIPALQRIEPVASRLPRNVDIAQAAVLLLEANGNRAEALPILKSMYVVAPTFEQKRWAANRIEEIKASVANAKK